MMRLPASDFGDPVTREPFVSSTTDSSIRSVPEARSAEGGQLAPPEAAEDGQQGRALGTPRAGPVARRSGKGREVIEWDA